jgi:acyl-coenzyme A thioesterase PaaI-like protein
MKNIINPFDKEFNMCFGCGIKNPIGLKLTFTDTDEHIQATWMPSETYQGYPNVLHGGIIASLLDEIGAWCIYVKLDTAGVTRQMNITYISPVFINKGEIGLSACIKERSEDKAILLCQLTDNRSKVCAEAIIEYFIYPADIAKKRLRYPGRDAFFENKEEEVA